MEAELAAHPEVLVAGPLTDDQRARRRADRVATADIYDREAAAAFEAGDYPLAVALLDAAERACPDREGYGTWDDLRAFVAAASEKSGGAR